MRKLVALLTALLLCSPASGAPFKLKMRVGVSSAASTLQGFLAGPNQFILATWVEPASLQAKWAAAGMNVAITGNEDFTDGTPGVWEAAVRASGQKIIMRADLLSNGGATNRYLSSNNDPVILSWFTYDEPDLYIALNQSPTQIDAEVAAARLLGATKPFFANFRGHVLSREYYVASDGITPMKAFVDMANVDWQSSDNYGFSGTDPSYMMNELYAQYSYRGPFSTMLGKAVRTGMFGPYNNLAIAHPGRPIFQYIALGRINDVSPGVPRARLTPTQYRLQAWSTVINGGVGLIHFPHYFPTTGPTLVDDSEPTLLAELATFKSKLAILQNQGGVNVLFNPTGGRRAFTLYTSADTASGIGSNYPTDQPQFVSPTTGQMPAWFEGMSSTVGAETYRCAVNLDDTNSHTLTFAALNITSVTFSPGQPMCFKASAPTVDILQ